MRYPFKVYSVKKGKCIAACEDAIDAARVVFWHPRGVVRVDGRLVWQEEEDRHLGLGLHDDHSKMRVRANTIVRRREENRIDTNKKFKAMMDRRWYNQNMEAPSGSVQNIPQE